MSIRTLVSLGIVLAASLPAQAEPRPAKPVRHKVVVIGASVSAGFADPTSKTAEGDVNRTLKLDAALKLVWPRKHARIYNFARLDMFRAPERFGREQVASAKKCEPALLVGVDFLAWFGYGPGGQVKDSEVDQLRLARQKKGLALLEAFTCPVVVGDYPDMRGSSAHMLPRSYIPNPATIAALNDSLAKWAKAHKNVHLFPLRKFVDEAVTKEQRYEFGERSVVFPRNFLLQSDRLHATELGMLVLVYRLHQSLPQVLRADHPLCRQRVTLDGLVHAARFEDRLPRPAAPTSRRR